MNLKKQALSGVKWTTIAKIVLAVVGLLKISILSRYLDPLAFGLMALINFVLGFMNVFMDLGLTSAILHKQDISKKEYASLYWINVIFSAILFLFISGISPLIAIFYNEPELKFFIPLMAISLILMAIGRQFRTIEQKELLFKKIAVTDIISASVGLITGAYLAISGYGVISLIFAALVQDSISNILYFVRGIKKRGLLFHLKFNETKVFLKIGMYQVGGQIVNYFNRDFDILLIGKFLGSEVLGLYSLSKQLVSYPMAILNPITISVASPILSKVQNNILELKHKYLYFLNLISTANFSAYLILILYTSPIIKIVFGADFISIAPIVQVLACYMYLRSVGSPIGSLVIATGKTYLEFYWNLLVLLILPLAVYIGIQFGILGVTYSLLFSMIFMTVLSWKLLVNKLIPVSLNDYLTALIPDYKRAYKLVKTDILKK